MSKPEQPKSVSVAQASVESAVQAAPGASPGSLGAQLASKREQLGWSVAEVASHLKLAPRQINAIETDNYAALPTMVMTRGFIRSYAKLLGLDAAALLATMAPAIAPQAATTAATSQLSTPFSESRFSLMGRNKLAYKWLLPALLLLLLAVAIRLDVLPGLQNTLTLTEKSTVSAITAASGEAGAGLPVGDEAPTAAGAALSAAPAADAVLMPEAGANAAAANVAPLTPSMVGGNQLSLNFREDSWVEIKRADNTVLISRLVKAGSSELVDMAQPVSIVIGNLAGVDATLRGVPLDLKGSSKTNVARLNLK